MLIFQHQLRRSLLDLSANTGTLPQIKEAVECGDDLSATDDDGETALHKLANRGFLEGAQYLVEQGADVYAKSDWDVGVLHYAALKKDNVECLRYFIDRHVDINAITKDGYTALHFASRWGYIENITELAHHGADLFAAECNGDTALHFAAKHSDVLTVRCLLELGGDPDIRNKKGETVFDVAKENNHDVFEFLVANDEMKHLGRICVGFFYNDQQMVF